MEYDPARDLPAVRCPVLAITGRNDIQVDPDDIRRIGDLVAGPFTGETPEALTHLLRVHAGPPSLDLLPGADEEARRRRSSRALAAWTKER